MPGIKFDITKFFAVVVAAVAILAAYGWYVGVEGAKELLMFVLGGIIGIVNPTPAKETIEISTPQNYRVKISATIEEAA